MTTLPCYWRHHYWQKLIRLTRSGFEGSVTILHDDDCALFDDPPDYCDCEPDLVLEPYKGARN